MRLSDPLSIIFVVFTTTYARVTFPFSEVLQFRDNQKIFNCVDDCKVYANQGLYKLQITQYGKVIKTFQDQDPINPKGIELNAGMNYSIDYDRGTYAPGEYTVYVVSRKAPNFGAPVFISQKKDIDIQIPNRFLTILSNTDSMNYNISGALTGYPKVFSTGFDTISDIYGEASCVPVYQSRAQYGAEHSEMITVYAPIVTIDFGGSPTRNNTVTVRPNITGFNPLEKTPSSTVYMTPGFIGCPFVGDEFYYYYYPRTVESRFTFISKSLDIAAESTRYTEHPSPLELRVNQDILDFSSRYPHSFTKHYGHGAYNVILEVPGNGSSWALQLDFGALTPPSNTTDTSSLGARLQQSWMIIIYISGTSTILVWLWFLFKGN